MFFFAQDRELAEEAWPGDVVGIPNHGMLRVGDTLTEGEELNFPGLPNFAPEILRRVRLEDPMQAKKLKPRSTSWPRRAWCSCSARSTARCRWSAWSASCSSTCCSRG